MGTKTTKQLSLINDNWKHRYCHGGELRKKRAGRRARPISTRDPLHLVFKSNRKSLRDRVTYGLIHSLVKKFANKFFVKIEQISIQHDHVHILVRAGKRSLLQNFLRVVAGRLVQTVTGASKVKYKGMRFWKHRPFSRVIKGWKPYAIVRNYIQLNEKEVIGKIPYRKERLSGLRPEELANLWA